MARDRAELCRDVGRAIVRAVGTEWQLYLLVAPLMLWFAVFSYAPMAGLQIAWKDYSLFKGIVGSPWVGFENFSALLGDPQFWRAATNTIVLSLLSLVLAFPVPVALAIAFSEIRHARLRQAAQVVTYLPHFISVVIVAGLVVALLAPSTGVVNAAREALGLERIYFLTRPEWFRTIFIGSNIWKEAGFDSIVYLAAISAIDLGLYEAARLDGASRWQLVRYITLPALIPTIVVLLLIRLGHIIEVGFEYIILLYQPATYETADVIATYVYRIGLQNSDSICRTSGLKKFRKVEYGR